jgi:hypothetical protein
VTPTTSSSEIMSRSAVELMSISESMRNSALGVGVELVSSDYRRQKGRFRLHRLRSHHLNHPIQ